MRNRTECPARREGGLPLRSRGMRCLITTERRFGMKRTLIGITAATLLALPVLSAGQSTPIPPEAARQSPLTQSGEQDISRQMPGQGHTSIPTTPPREDAPSTMVSRAQEELRELGFP